MSTKLSMNSGGVQGSCYPNVCNPTTAPRPPPPRPASARCASYTTEYTAERACEFTPHVAVRPPQTAENQMPSSSLVAHVTATRFAGTRPPSVPRVVERPASAEGILPKASTVDRASVDFRRHMAMRQRLLFGRIPNKANEPQQQVQRVPALQTSAVHDARRAGGLPLQPSPSPRGPHADDVQHICSDKHQSIVVKAGDFNQNARRLYQDSQSVYRKDYAYRSGALVPSKTPSTNHVLLRLREVPYHDQPSRQWHEKKESDIPLGEAAPPYSWRSVVRTGEVLGHSTGVVSRSIVLRRQREMRHNPHMPPAGLSTVGLDKHRA